MGTTFYGLEGRVGRDEGRRPYMVCFGKIKFMEKQ